MRLVLSLDETLKDAIAFDCVCVYFLFVCVGVSVGMLGSSHGRVLCGLQKGHIVCVVYHSKKRLAINVTSCLNFVLLLSK